METHKGVATFHAKSTSEWRRWLEKNHSLEKKLWLIIYHKDSETPSVYYDEAVDEALCFGWIDSSINKRDGESYYQYFAKRNPKSNWSRVNKEKIERLLSKNRIAPAGLDMIKTAKQTETWTALDDVENLIIPADLNEAFDKLTASSENFEAFPRSVKRGILEWLFNAKRAETRQKRIKEISEMAQRNERANQYRP
ncbi:MAG: YdeI/OmpD-associated family protein [Spirosomaceae bacterium]|nr:YdeI/OmpD-associated family protein [Spirosomataceae bacterium]